MSFEFRDEVKTLVINGHEFTVTVGDIEALAAGEELAARLQGLDFAALGAGGYRALAAELTATIDQVLGEGATARVLEGRRPTVTGLVSLMAYVLKESAADFGAAVDGLVADLTVAAEE